MSEFTIEDICKIIKILHNDNPIIRSRCLIIGEKYDKDNSIGPSDDSYQLGSI
jgi:hypothetical protein